MLSWINSHSSFLISFPLSPFHSNQHISVLPKISSCLTILLRLCFSSFSFVAFPHHIKSFCLETHTSREATGRQSEITAVAKSLTENPPIWKRPVPLDISHFPPRNLQSKPDGSVGAPPNIRNSCVWKFLSRICYQNPLQEKLEERNIICTTT